MAKIDKLIEKAQSHLEPGENIIASVLGAYETKIMKSDTVRNGIFLATDQRLVFYAKKLAGYDLEVFPYSSISSIDMGKDLMGHRISLFASGNKTSMKWINTGDVQQFVQIVKERIGKKEEKSNPTIDIAEQIKKIAELKDLGILTEEEFTSKKQELLLKM
jgi:hypothetical protein